MTFAFGHLIGAWLLGKVYEYKSKKHLSHYAWLFLLFGAILPDADFIIDWVLGTELHRTFTHSLLFVVITPFCLYVILKNYDKEDSFACALAFAGGIFSHVFLDFFSSQGVPLFWPSLVNFAYNHVAYFDPATPSFLHSSPEQMRSTLRFAVLDMALGTAWIFYMWWKKKVEF